MLLLDKFSFKFELFNTPVKIHWSLTLLFFVSILQSLSKFSVLWTTFVAIYMGPILALTILGHEVGHILMIKALGWEIGEDGISLWPLGGLLEYSGRPQEPSSTLKVALAGPATHILQGALWFSLFTFYTDGEVNHFAFEVPMPELEHNFFAILYARAFILNVYFLVFNLLPAYPLNGGYALSSILQMRGEDNKSVGLMIGRTGIIVSFYGLFFGFITTFMRNDNTSAIIFVVFIHVMLSSVRLLQKSSDPYGTVDDHPLFALTCTSSDEKVPSTTSESTTSTSSTTKAYRPWWNTGFTNEDDKSSALLSSSIPIEATTSTQPTTTTSTTETNTKKKGWWKKFGAKFSTKQRDDVNQTGDDDGGVTV